MQPAKLLFTTLSLFALAVTGNPLTKRNDQVDNYATLKTAMGKTAPVVGKHYALYEYWSASTENVLCDYVKNSLAHAGLVVGTVSQGTSGPEFTATRFDLTKNGEGSSGISAGGGLCKGGKLETGVHISATFENKWHRDTSHTYTFAGEITTYAPMDMAMFGKPSEYHYDGI